VYSTIRQLCLQRRRSIEKVLLTLPYVGIGSNIPLPSAYLGKSLPSSQREERSRHMRRKVVDCMLWAGAAQLQGYKICTQLHVITQITTVEKRWLSSQLILSECIHICRFTSAYKKILPRRILSSSLYTLLKRKHDLVLSFHRRNE
jgi:hypothetical protein